MRVRGRLALVALAVASIAAVPTTRRTARSASRTSATHLATTAASTAPATRRATATVDAAVEPLLAQIDAAYAKGPLQIEGDLVGTFDVAGRSKTYTLHIIGRTDGSGRFVHAAASAGQIVSDGRHGTLFDRRRNAFAKFDTTADRVAAADLEPSLISVLLDENPALLLSLTSEPAGVLRLAATRIRRAAPSTRPSSQPTATSSTAPASEELVLETEAKTVTLRLDPSDGMIVGSEIDYTPLMSARKAVAVKAARATLTYQRALHEAPSADAFVWQPPATATEFSLHPELMMNPMPTTKPR